jgi:hypothetical protein
MDYRPLLGAGAYLGVTFPLAILWHVVAFRPTYDQLGYFERDPIFALGFLAILVQGLLLSYSYAWLFPQRRGFSSAIRFASVAGVFFWSCHVVAHAAKQQVGSIGLFFAIETCYLALQFGLFGTLLGLLYRGESARESRAA